jgi:hypothetical protein
LASGFEVYGPGLDTPQAWLGIGARHDAVRRLTAELGRIFGCEPDAAAIAARIAAGEKRSLVDARFREKFNRRIAEARPLLADWRAGAAG